MEHTGPVGFTRYVCSLAKVNVFSSVRFSVEVPAQADDVILHSGKSELFVQMKLTEKMFQELNYVMLL